MGRGAAVVACVFLVVPTGGAHAAGACQGGGDVALQTLTVTMEVPRTVHSGKTALLPVTVTRTDLPAADVEVRVALAPQRGDRAWRSATTDSRGRVTVRLSVPSNARGTAVVTATAHKPHARLPCHNEVVEEGESAARSVELD